jgi:hypothetical protein
MRLKTQRKAIYVAMGLTVLALVGGYTAANLAIGGSTNSAQQGSHTTNIGQVTGLSWNGTAPTMFESTLTNTSGCASEPGCAVSSSAATVCAGSTHAGTWCAAGDFGEEVVLNTTANSPFAHDPMNITIYVTVGSTVYTGETFYFTDSGSNARELITICFDTGTASAGPAPVSDITVIAED